MKVLYNVDKLIRFEELKDVIQHPIIIRVTDFNDEAVEDFAKDMEAAHQTGQPIIPIMIDSPGGHIYSLLSMISYVQNSKIPIATVAIGHAMSCGSILLSCGAEGMRFTDLNTSIMLHDVSAMHWGKNEEIKSASRQIDRLNKQIFHLMAKNCGHKDKNYFLNIIHEKKHAEWFLTARDAKKHNIVNEIRVPDLCVDVSVNMSFK